VEATQPRIGEEQWIRTGREGLGRESTVRLNHQAAPSKEIPGRKSSQMCPGITPRHRPFLSDSNPAGTATLEDADQFLKDKIRAVLASS